MTNLKTYIPARCPRCNSGTRAESNAAGKVGSAYCSRCSWTMPIFKGSDGMWYIRQ